MKPLRSCPQPFTAYAERFLRQEQLFPCNLRLLGCPSQSRACRFLLRLFLLPFRLRNSIFRQRRLMRMVRCAADRASRPLREVLRQKACLFAQIKRFRLCCLCLRRLPCPLCREVFFLHGLQILFLFGDIRFLLQKCFNAFDEFSFSGNRLLLRFLLQQQLFLHKKHRLPFLLCLFLCREPFLQRLYLGFRRAFLRSKPFRLLLCFFPLQNPFFVRLQSAQKASFFLKLWLFCIQKQLFRL